ncbi:AAA family ATPase [Candidatus Woesearchaeota archaeon]|nr:AAA family ATPase [Candidatus Woesearchaeota archaeon]
MTGFSGGDRPPGSGSKGDSFAPFLQQRPKKTVEQIIRENTELVQENGQLKTDLRAVREALENASGQIESLLEPPFKEGVIVKVLANKRAEVMTYEGKFISHIYSGLDASQLSSGQFVKLTEQKVIVEIGEYCNEGHVLEVDDVFPDGRIIVKHHLDDRMTVIPTERIDAKKLQAGNRLLCYGTLAVEEIPGSSLKGILLEEKLDTTFADLAGLDDQITKITRPFDLLLDAPDVYEEFLLKFPKGILLHGPPGNGKTSIVKGLVNYLSEKLNVPVPFYVVHIADVYKHWLGDSENFVKSLFAETRKKAEEYPFVIVLLDEPETFLKKRGKGISTDANEGVINQFCAELDGLKNLRNVMIIYGTNRLDMMDPAILRPGRIDKKIYVPQPTKEACVEIMLKYLVPPLPLDPGEARRYNTVHPASAMRAMARHVVEEVLFSDLPQYHCGTAYYPDGTSQELFYRHLVNGALFPNIVEKAKEMAVIRYIETHKCEKGIRTEDLELAAHEAFHENAYISTTNRDEWSKILGKEVESIRARPPEVKADAPKAKDKKKWVQ